MSSDDDSVRPVKRAPTEPPISRSDDSDRQSSALAGEPTAEELATEASSDSLPERWPDDWEDPSSVLPSELSSALAPRDSYELTTTPKELQIQKSAGRSLLSGSVSWLPVALLAPFAFMVEAVPAAIAILFVVGLTTRELRKSRTNVLPYLQLADKGNLEEASLRIAELAKKEKDWMRKSFLIGLLSAVELRSGNYEIAESLARESIKFKKKSQPLLERSLHANLAMILTVQGKLDEAIEHMPKRKGADPLTDMQQMLLLARQGHWEDVANFNYRQLPEVRGLQHSARLIALFKAMALEITGGGALKVQRYLDKAKPNLDDEFDYIQDSWPELKEFISHHPELRRSRNLLRPA